jgi:hypothetical protein
MMGRENLKTRLYLNDARELAVLINLAPHLHVIICFHNQQPIIHHSTFIHTPSTHPSIMPPLFWTLGCIYGASSVMLGAFGAHGLKKKIADPQRLANWNTAAHYQVRNMV